MGWRSDARDAIRDYPRLKQKEKDLKSVSAVANYGDSVKLSDGSVINVLLPGGGTASRTTEDVALRHLPPEEQKRLEAVERAIQVTRSRYADAEKRLELVRLMYWSRRCSMAGAAQKLFISYSTASRWNVEFADLIDIFLREI